MPAAVQRHGDGKEGIDVLQSFMDAGVGSIDGLSPSSERGLFIRWMETRVLDSGSHAITDSVRGDVDEDHDGVLSGGEDSDRNDADDADVSRLFVVASLSSEDRLGDVIDADGWELGSYRKNPVFLWAHQRSMPPIGRSVRTWVEDGSLHALVEFAPTPFGREVSDLFRRGFMRGVSVGFRPLEMSRRRSSSGRQSYLFKRQELLEISAAPVPMHKDALIAAPDPAADEDRSIDVTAAGISELRVALRDLWKFAEVLI